MSEPYIFEHKIERKEDHKQKDREVFNAGDIFLYDLKAVTTEIPGPDHYGHSEECRDTIGGNKFQRMHVYGTRGKKYLGP